MSSTTTVLPSLPQLAGTGSAAPTTQAQVDLRNPARRFVYALVVAFVFLRFSLLHELLAEKIGFNSYLLAIIGGPAVLGMFLLGAIPRTLKLRASRYWLAFFVWVIVAVPFSVWRSGSFRLAETYGRTELCALFMIAGMPLIWSECRKLLYAIALGSFFCVLIGRVFMITNYGGQRMSLAFGTVANSNDFAAHLLAALPFLLFVIMSPRVKRFFRGISVLALLYGLFLVLDTASRGALLAVSAVGLYVFWRSSGRVRISMLVGLPVLVVAAVAVLPGYVVTRLQSFTTSSRAATDAASREAADSARLRQYEFNTSVRYTLEHPLFGVGPGQFSTYEGENTKALGAHGFWTETHSILTQVSSECGIPAFIFFVSAIVSTWLLIHRVQKLARLHGLREIWAASFCLALALLGFFTAALFLNLAYRFYLPALTGLAIALYAATMQEVGALRSSSARPFAQAMPVIASAPFQTAVAQVPARTAVPSRRYRFGRLR